MQLRGSNAARQSCVLSIASLCRYNPQHKNADRIHCGEARAPQPLSIMYLHYNGFDAYSAREFFGAQLYSNGSLIAQSPISFASGDFSSGAHEPGTSSTRYSSISPPSIQSLCLTDLAYRRTTRAKYG
ncbi:MAG: hypothetical protein JO217_12025 [Acidobacteriaceae bacterium]|nr:hypothetical protein [Acidobacteriaceae bacterium]MBV9443412.1 hypothetical protein [Acidobacteriaceae bacterium]